MKNLICVTLIIIISLNCLGQNKWEEPVEIPPSPQAQLFQQYINHQVTEYHGLPEISIPLYELELHGLRIPISLNYHAGGIKYKQFDGDVGVGWSLNIESYRISRDINGRPDEFAEKLNLAELNSILLTGKNNEIDPYLGAFCRSYRPKSADENDDCNHYDFKDGEFDMYTYSLPASNGYVINNMQIGNNKDMIKIIAKKGIENACYEIRDSSFGFRNQAA